MRLFDKYLLSNVPREGENQQGNNQSPPPPPPPPPPVDAWHTGLDADTVGHIQNRGWDKKDAKEAAREAVKAHREAEKNIGVPADRLIRLPANRGDAEAMKRDVWSRLGVPADAKEYDFSSVKRAGGKDLDAGFVDGVRATVAAQNIPKDAAVEVVKGVVKALDAKEAADLADRTAKLAESKVELDKNWGANKEANLFVAKQGAAKLGFTPAEVDALEGVVGYAKIMEGLRKVGALAGEDKFVNQGGGGGGVMTKDQAVAKKADLMKDTAWVKRYLEGGTAEGREMTALNTLITGTN